MSVFSCLKTSTFALALAAFVVGLSGCASKPQQTFMSESDPAVQSLNESALRIARAAEQAALSQSVAAKRNRVTSEFKIDLAKLPPELRDPLLLENGFNGELEPFLRSIADVIGWPAPIILGNRPTTPLQVNFTEQRRPPALWIADAGYQAGSMAKITINAQLRQITIRYAEAGGVR